MYYGKDLACIHDAGFTDLARGASAIALRILKQRGFTRGLVVDLGCGSGVVAEKLTCAGYDVLGIDVSAAMLLLARRRAPKAQFRHASLFQAAIPNCYAVTAIGEAVNYLPGSSSHNLAKLFGRVHRALVPSGIFMLDVAVIGYPPVPAFQSVGKDWAVLVTKIQDAPRQVLTRRMTIFRRVGTLYRRTEETHRQKLHPAAQIRQQLRDAGFQVRSLEGYGTVKFAPGRLGFVAYKK